MLAGLTPMAVLLFWKSLVVCSVAVANVVNGLLNVHDPCPPLTGSQMPIKHLENHLSQQKHVQTLALSALSDSRLGIDASHYIQHLLDSPSSREPLLAATGGLPLALSSRIEADLRVLERLNIKPVFVFPGLPPNKRWKPNPHLESAEACRDRRDAWAKYESGQEDQATKLFEGRSCFAQWDLWRMILRIFRHRNVEFIIAPYLAWAQLIYLQRHNKSYIHAIYGPTDTLLYPGVDKVITHIDLTSANPTFQYVSKRNILQELAVSEDQFLDICILVGFDHSPPFPPTIHEQALKATVDMVKYYKTGHAAVSAFAEHPAVKSIQYLDHFARTRSMIKFSLILSSEGTVMPLPLAIPSPAGHGHPGHHHHPTAADIPSDLHEIFTHRLPDEVFFYLSRGLLGPQVLIWLTSGQIVENPPLDNGETTEYKRFVKEVITDGQTGPRATALALVSGVSQSFWANRKVQGLFWFDQPSAHGGGSKFIAHNSAQTTQLVERVGGWNVPYPIIEEELRRQNSSTIDFALCLGATATDRLAARTKVKNPNSAPLEKKDEVVANVIWRFLELRGFLLNTHTHSALARAMYTAIKQARVNDKFQDPLYLFLELVRAGVMHGHLWSGRAFSGGPSFGVEDEKASMLLVMRVLSIVPLSFKAQAWSAPLSRELLVFNSFVRSLTRALRTLLEVTSLNMLLRNDARRARDDLLDITLSLPFQTEVNTGFGVLAKVYLDALTHINNRTRVRDPNAEGVKEAKQLALEICEDTFPGVKNPKLEVERGFRFWDVALTAMRQLHSEGAVLRELIDQFEAAEAWLAPMRP
ncbi:XPG I-region protein [Coprinopsis cinerea okayama7|uniref:XPG I-region protein n=1 Tax=Coprinopsis cinerea (strain Okayama-7 / 130 / ATCC MYA-4618 / FGSC 9003) TaxID=240176 RepID=A8NAE0_COPC7|nr:XPG I-region protein [Coprinopsis cinerea okayama7\|eukprot:XP_001831792.2 XPG I-region protein [Coprinopsis cinerea okayama7\